VFIGPFLEKENIKKESFSKSFLVVNEIDNSTGIVIGEDNNGNFSTKFE